MAKLEVSLSSRQEEGLKLTFSKQALMPNGSGGESSRKRRKEHEVRVSDLHVLPYNDAYTRLLWINYNYLFPVLVIRPRRTE